MNTAFAPGQPVKISRPGRTTNGAIGRYVEPGQSAGFAWVSLHKTNAATMPSLDDYRKQATYNFKLFPLSQLVAL